MTTIYGKTKFLSTKDRETFVNVFYCTIYRPVGIRGGIRTLAQTICRAIGRKIVVVHT